VFEWVRDIDGSARADQQDFHTFNDIQDVVLSAFGCLFLKTNGTVRIWTRGNLAQTLQVPAAAQNDVQAIAAGIGHYLALKKDGTVIVWGDNAYGQCAVPAQARDIVRIGCGDYHSFAVTRDQRIIAWGDNRRGQCDVPTNLR
jgi:alpha-tubulin suppressor-like RCC1 family protein